VSRHPTASGLACALLGAVGACTGTSPGLAEDAGAALPEDSRTDDARSGYVTAYSGAFMREQRLVEEYSVVVSFTSISRCVLAWSQGACAVYECQASGPDPVSVSPDDGGPAPHAGTVQIIGGRVPATVSPGLDGMYRGTFRSHDLLFAGAETLSLSGAGASVPSFSVSLSAPTTVTITDPPNPVRDGVARLSVRRSVPLDLAWTGGTGQLVQTTIESVPSTSGIRRLRCSFGVDAGAGMVPPAALGLLPRGEARMEVQVRSAADVAAGDWQVRFVAITPAVLPDRAIAVQALELE
jgi:hypothetical protein